MDIDRIVKVVLLVFIILIILNAMGIFIVNKYYQCASSNAKVTPELENCQRYNIFGTILASPGIFLLNFFTDYYKIENSFIYFLIFLASILEIVLSIVVSCIIFNKKLIFNE
jgi:hypothetical protein